MTTRLTLICHASTAAARASAFPANEPLDAQARKKLADFRPRLHDADRRFTSPALRALQTAEALNLAATVEPMLRDCDYARWAGRSLEAVAAEEPEAVAAWLSDPDAAPHGGESLSALIARIAQWLDAQRARPGRVVAVTHASVVRAAVVHAIEAPPRSFWRIDVAPLSAIRLSASHSRWTLACPGAGEAEGGAS